MTHKRINRWVGAVAGAVCAMMVSSGAGAANRTDLAHIHAGKESKIPIGWVQFCADNPRECLPSAQAGTPVSATPTRMRELNEVNVRFNTLIEPVTDQDQYGVVEKWTYATTGKGDCEDYVLEKRRELARRGWPLSQLLITVVLDKQNGGHAVLTVVTDRGEFILDNQTDRILPWSASDLTFIKRQSPDDPNAWLDLGRLVGRPDFATASTSRR